MTVIHSDCLEAMAAMDADSIDSIVSDPPYGLAFMGKAWDHGVPGEPFWREALRVAKPGAYLVAFGGTRTFHRLTCAIEDAGWEIRDCLSWLYGSGFPKSHNGPWGGTALKPAWEPIILARKPLIGTVAANVTVHGTGGLNVDGCRIGTDLITAHGGGVNGDGRKYGGGSGIPAIEAGSNPHVGRWPANVCLDEEAAEMLDAQSGHSKSPPKGSMGGGSSRHRGVARGEFAGVAHENGYGDSGGASRFFYTAKASRREREAGLEGMPRKEVRHYDQTVNNGSGGLRNGDGSLTPVQNHHPTVKPIALMRWLCRLVTPPNGLVLDPFTGSGTTGCAAVLEGFRFVGCEKEAEYVEIARKRIAHWTPEPSLL